MDKTRPLVFSSPWDHGPSHHASVYTQPRAAGHHLMGHRGASAEPRWVCGPLPPSSPSWPPGVSPRLPLGLLPGPLPPGLSLLLLQPFLLLARQIWVQAQGTGSGLRVTGRAEGRESRCRSTPHTRPQMKSHTWVSKPQTVKAVSGKPNPVTSAQVHGQVRTPAQTPARPSPAGRGASGLGGHVGGGGPSSQATFK